jgi:hypothetical protein
MRLHRTALLATLVALPLGSAPVQAAGFVVEPMVDGKNFLGCMASNEASGLIFVAVAGSFSVMLSAPEFKVAKGDKVDGSWAVDDGKPQALSASANGPGIVSIDMDATKENIALFADGDEVKARIGKASHTFSLASSDQALADLRACMKTGAAK